VGAVTKFKTFQIHIDLLQLFHYNLATVKTLNLAYYDSQPNY